MIRTIAPICFHLFQANPEMYFVVCCCITLSLWFSVHNIFILVYDHTGEYLVKTVRYTLLLLEKNATCSISMKIMLLYCHLSPTGHGRNLPRRAELLLRPPRKLMRFLIISGDPRRRYADHVMLEHIRIRGNGDYKCAFHISRHIKMSVISQVKRRAVISEYHGIYHPNISLGTPRFIL